MVAIGTKVADMVLVKRECSYGHLRLGLIDGAGDAPITNDGFGFVEGSPSSDSRTPISAIGNRICLRCKYTCNQYSHPHSIRL